MAVIVATEKESKRKAWAVDLIEKGEEGSVRLKGFEPPHK